jgi:hypothetical protein
MSAAPTWPDGSPRSTGNGFDLARRRAQGPSIFATPAEQGKATAHERGVANGQKARAKKPGAEPGHGHATMPNLSERATRQLKKGPAPITLGKLSDTEKRTRAKRAAI